MAWRAARGAGTDNTEAAGARHWHAGWPHRHAGAAGPDTTRAGRPPCAGDADRPARHARAALAAFEAAERRHPGRRSGVRRQLRRAANLPDIAEASLEAGELGRAAAYADEMLARGMGPVAPWDWNGGNLVHHGHVTLGRLALIARDLDAAEEHLRLAGSTHGSPQLDSFGPDFHLANELLARGRTESVLEYLDLCRRFWTLGHDALDGWTAELRAGRRPVLREFGIDPDDD